MHDTLQACQQAINQVLLGKQTQVRLALACLLARGHLLLEDLPGMGKTTLSQALARVLGLSYQRIQFTSDLLPGDILGTSVFDRQSSAFVFHPGPIFAELVLADEINRATPKSQSALLEAMEEGHVSIDGKNYELPQPFWVVATQNPTEHSGTNALPESQLDRFLIKVSLGYPDEQSEKRMLARAFEDRRGSVVASQGIDVLAERTKAQAVALNTATLDYLYRLVRATREPSAFRLGLSPRAALGLVAITKAWAYLHNRSHATPDDVREVFPSVAAHRVFPTTLTPMHAIEGLLQHLPIHA